MNDGHASLLFFVINGLMFLALFFVWSGEGLLNGWLMSTCLAAFLLNVTALGLIAAGAQ